MDPSDNVVWRITRRQTKAALFSTFVQPAQLPKEKHYGIARKAMRKLEATFETFCNGNDTTNLLPQVHKLFADIQTLYEGLSKDIDYIKRELMLQTQLSDAERDSIFTEYYIYFWESVDDQAEDMEKIKTKAEALGLNASTFFGKGAIEENQESSQPNDWLSASVLSLMEETEPMVRSIVQDVINQVSSDPRLKHTKDVQTRDIEAAVKDLHMVASRYDVEMATIGVRLNNLISAFDKAVSSRTQWKTFKSISRETLGLFGGYTLRTALMRGIAQILEQGYGRSERAETSLAHFSKQVDELKREITTQNNPRTVLQLLCEGIALQLDDVLYQMTLLSFPEITERVAGRETTTSFWVYYYHDYCEATPENTHLYCWWVDPEGSKVRNNKVQSDAPYNGVDCGVAPGWNWSPDKKHWMGVLDTCNMVEHGMWSGCPPGIENNAVLTFLAIYQPPPKASYVPLLLGKVVATRGKAGQRKRSGTIFVSLLPDASPAAGLKSPTSNMAQSFTPAVACEDVLKPTGRKEFSRDNPMAQLAVEEEEEDNLHLYHGHGIQHWGIHTSAILVRLSRSRARSVSSIAEGHRVEIPLQEGVNHIGPEGQMIAPDPRLSLPVVVARVKPTSEELSAPRTGSVLSLDTSRQVLSVDVEDHGETSSATPFLWKATILPNTSLDDSKSNHVRLSVNSRPVEYGQHILADSDRVSINHTTYLFTLRAPIFEGAVSQRKKKGGRSKWKSYWGVLKYKPGDTEPTLQLHKDKKHEEVIRAWSIWCIASISSVVEEQLSKFTSKGQPITRSINSTRISEWAGLGTGDVKETPGYFTLELTSGQNILLRVRNKDLRKQWVRVISFLLKDRRKRQTAKVREEANKRREMRSQLFSSSKWDRRSGHTSPQLKRASGIGGYRPLSLHRSSSEIPPSRSNSESLSSSKEIVALVNNVIESSDAANLGQSEAESPSEPTEMTGWLVKKGKKRWFYLTKRGVLHWFDSPDKIAANRPPNGSLIVSGASVGIDTDKSGFFYAVVTEKRQYRLKTPSQEEATKWADAMLAYGAIVDTSLSQHWTKAATAPALKGADEATGGQCGWLIKKGKRRWFQVSERGETLSWYSSPPKNFDELQQSNGSLNLRDCRVVKITGETKGLYSFKIYSVKSSTYYTLFHKDESVTSEWVRILNRKT